jgi:hypothetical protein
VLSSLLGRTYGQVGNGLPAAVSLVAIAMGLNLLGLLPLKLPSLDVDVRQLSAPPLIQVLSHTCDLDCNAFPRVNGLESWGLFVTLSALLVRLAMTNALCNGHLLTLLQMIPLMGLHAQGTVLPASCGRQAAPATRTVLV